MGLDELIFAKRSLFIAPNFLFVPLACRRRTTHMVEGIRDENGWTFASDLSPERLAELQGLVAANGLSPAVGTTGDAGEEAFARMVAANPNATVVGGPAGSAETSAPSAGLLGGGSWVFSSDLSAESLAQVIP